MRLLNHWICSFATGLALLGTAPVFAAPETVQVAASLETDGTTRLVHEGIIDAPISDVWAAISTAEGWMTWAVPMAWASTSDADILETSYSKTDVPGSPGTIQQKFSKRIPERLLAFRTVKVPEGFPHGAEYLKVSSKFELEPVGKKTKLRLTSTGYPDNEGGKALVAFFTKGNTMTLEALQKRFADGPVDWNKATGGE